jgi:hypothetical protein
MSLSWRPAVLSGFVPVFVGPWGPPGHVLAAARLNMRAINVPQDAASRRPLPRATTNRGPTARVVFGWGVALGREIDTLAR